MASLQEQLGAMVRHHRLRSGLSQQELADKIGRTAVQVSRIETGKSAPNFESLGSLAAALNVSVRDLFGSGEYAAQDGRSDQLVEIVKLLSQLTEPELATIRSLVENALELRRS